MVNALLIVVCGVIFDMYVRRLFFMDINIDENKLYEMIRNAVSDAVKQEMASIRLQLLRYADEKEMDTINELFESPNKYDDEEFEEFE
jgi:hypothetical protein